MMTNSYIILDVKSDKVEAVNKAIFEIEIAGIKIYKICRICKVTPRKQKFYTLVTGETKEGQILKEFAEKVRSIDGVHKLIDIIQTILIYMKNKPEDKPNPEKDKPIICSTSLLDKRENAFTVALVKRFWNTAA